MAQTKDVYACTVERAGVARRIGTADAPHKAARMMTAILGYNVFAIEIIDDGEAYYIPNAASQWRGD